MLCWPRSLRTPVRRPPLPESGSFYALSRLFPALGEVYSDTVNSGREWANRTPERGICPPLRTRFLAPGLSHISRLCAAFFLTFYRFYGVVCSRCLKTPQGGHATRQLGAFLCPFHGVKTFLGYLWAMIASNVCRVWRICPSVS